MSAQQSPWLVARALLAHWRRHPGQFAMLLVGLSMATALFVGVQAINAEARKSYGVLSAQHPLFKADYLAPRGQSRSGADVPTIALDSFIQLRRAGWRVSPLVWQSDWSLGDRRLTLVGVEPVTLLDADIDSPALPQLTAEMPADAWSRLFISPQLAGDSLIKETAATQGLVIEAHPDVPPGFAITDIGYASEILGLNAGTHHRLAVLAEPPGALPTALRKRLVRVRPAESVPLAELTDSFHLNLTAFGLLSFLVGLFIVYSALSLATQDRLATMRVLMACGVDRWLLLRAMAIEMLLLALGAGAVGVILGYLMAAALMPGVAGTLAGLYGARVDGAISLSPLWWGRGLLISLLGVAVTGGLTLGRLAFLPILAMRPGARWHAGEAKALKVQTALGASVALAALLLAAYGETLTAAFASMAAVLLSAALLLPAALTGCAWLGEKLAMPGLTRWFWSDMRFQLPKLSLALMALVLALGVQLGIALMIGGFRDSFTQFLDERLAPELYVRAPDADSGRQLAKWLESDPRIDAVLPSWRARTSVGGAPVDIYSFVDHPTYSDIWRFIDARSNAWSLAAQGDGVLVSEQLARAEGLSIGDPVRFDARDGTLTLPVVAIYADYGNLIGQARLGAGFLTAHFDLEQQTDYAVRTNTRLPPLIKEIKNRFDVADTQILDQKSLKAEAMRIFNRTFQISDALAAFTLAVAGFALLANLITVFEARLPQLAPLWGMGVSRRRLVLLEGAQIVLLTLLTAGVALGLGIAVAWVLNAQINVAAFGWRLPLVISVPPILTMLGLALVTALAASAYPLMRLWRMPPANIAKTFAAEA